MRLASTTKWLAVFAATGVLSTMFFSAGRLEHGSGIALRALRRGRAGAVVADVKMVTVVDPFTSVHQIVDGTALSAATVSGVGWSYPFGPTESTAWRGRVRSRSSSRVA
jgi:hypothetical protein